jgi:CDP-glucose 4,6-dehydratase
MYKNVYKNKKVLVTGHTGFKGAWLTIWLLRLGANVVGVSKDIPTSPSMFDELSLAEKITDYREDIRDLSKIKEIINCSKK